MHDTEEAHVLLEGTAQYRIGDKTFTVQAPYVAKVPAGVPHTFINAGTKRFNLIAVFSSKQEPRSGQTRDCGSGWKCKSSPSDSATFCI